MITKLDEANKNVIFISQINAPVIMQPDASHKLVPMTTFVIEYYSHEGYADLQTLKLMKNYANFLKKPLHLGMFVPVDQNGNVLKEPRNYTSWKALDHNSKGDSNDNSAFEEYRIYLAAEQRCLFKDFKVDYNGYSRVRIIADYNHSIELSFNKNDLSFLTFHDVESLTAFDEIYLTRTALRLIGIKKK